MIDLVRARILRALGARRRYKYVSPRVERRGDGGWVVFSPNCSRSVDSNGGDIAIAWLQPQGDSRWRLHARDHAAQAWVPLLQGQTLPQALQRLCADPQREFWV
jgi:hypothetical protein